MPKILIRYITRGMSTISDTKNGDTSYHTYYQGKII